MNFFLFIIAALIAGVFFGTLIAMVSLLERIAKALEEANRLKKGG